MLHSFGDIGRKFEEVLHFSVLVCAKCMQKTTYNTTPIVIDNSYYGISDHEYGHPSVCKIGDDKQM